MDFGFPWFCLNMDYIPNWHRAAQHKARSLRKEQETPIWCYGFGSEWNNMVDLHDIVDLRMVIYTLYIHLYTCVCIYIYMYVCVSKYLCIYICSCIYIYMYTFIHTCISTSIYMCIYVCLHVSVCYHVDRIYVYSCVYTVYIYIHIRLNYMLDSSA